MGQPVNNPSKFNFEKTKKLTQLLLFFLVVVIAVQGLLVNHLMGETNSRSIQNPTELPTTRGDES
ncbi:MAG: hypothetical protein HQL69_15780 [Magnetococcales bacterium]|nr:hypothetical protein [Magnetococcales bacterium]